MKRFIPSDQNTVDLIRDYIRKNGMIYDVFMKYHEDTITAKTVAQLIEEEHEISSDPDSYHHFPFLSDKNFKLTAWPGWVSSGFYEKFSYDGKFINVEHVAKNTITLSEYEQMVYRILEENFKKIFNEHKKFILFYSRGIDSIVVLSYLMKYDLLNNTEIIYVKNKSQMEIDVGLEKEVANIDVEILDFYKDIEKNITPWINQPNPFDLYHYQSRYISELYKDDHRPLLNGTEGNSILLHSPLWVKRTGKKPKTENAYVQSVYSDVDWNVPLDPEYDIITGIQPGTQKLFPWASDRYYKNFLHPISDHRLMEVLPFIDAGNIDADYIADALLCRNIVNKNVGNKLDALIVKENKGWIAFPDDIHIDKENIDPDYLKINTIKSSSSMQTFSYLKEGIMEKDKIDVQLLLHLKFNNWLLNNKKSYQVTV